MSLSSTKWTRKRRRSSWVFSLYFPVSNFVVFMVQRFIQTIMTRFCQLEPSFDFTSCKSIASCIMAKFGCFLCKCLSEQSRMIDYIVGVQDPVEWHSQNLKMNKNHYASWMVYLGGPKLITRVADNIGAGVHFNPFVSWNDKTFKYGAAGMHNLVQDILNWENFYLSGRLQKPVHILVDNLDVEHLNSINLRAAASAALLLLPANFTEEDLYAKICSLSYMGDLRMYFAEDRHKVKKIVQGQFDLFRKMYMPVLEEFVTKDLLRFSTSSIHQEKMSQDCGLPAAQSLVSCLPKSVKSYMGMKLGEQQSIKSGEVQEVNIRSRADAANSIEKFVRRKVLVSSARQAVSGLLTVGITRGSRYLAHKLRKSWKSWF